MASAVDVGLGAPADPPPFHAFRDGDDVVLDIHPTTPAPIRDRHVVLALDTSGSVASFPADRFRESLRTVLQSLQESGARVTVMTFSDVLRMVDFRARRVRELTKCTFDADFSRSLPAADRVTVSRKVPDIAALSPYAARRLSAEDVVWIVERVLGHGDFYRDSLIGGFTWMATALQHAVQFAALTPDTQADVVCIGDGFEMYGVTSEGRAITRNAKSVAADVARDLAESAAPATRLHMLAISDDAALDMFLEVARVGNGMMSYIQSESDLGLAFGKLFEAMLVQHRHVAVSVGLRTALPAQPVTHHGIEHAALGAAVTHAAFPTARRTWTLLGRFDQGGVVRFPNALAAAPSIGLHVHDGACGGASDAALVTHELPRLASALEPLPARVKAIELGAARASSLLDLLSSRAEVRVADLARLQDAVLMDMKTLDAEEHAAGATDGAVPKKLDEHAAANSRRSFVKPVLEKVLGYIRAAVEDAGEGAATWRPGRDLTWRAAIPAAYQLWMFGQLSALTPPAECAATLQRLDMGFDAARRYDAFRDDMEAWVEAKTGIDEVDDGRAARYVGFNFETGLMGIPAAPVFHSASHAAAFTFAKLSRQFGVKPSVPLELSPDGALVEMLEFDELRRRGNHVDGAITETVAQAPDGSVTIGDKPVRSDKARQRVAELLRAGRSAVRTSVTAVSFFVPVVARRGDLRDPAIRKMAAMRLAEIQQNDRLDWQRPALPLKTYGLLVGNLLMRHAMAGDVPRPLLQTAVDLARTLLEWVAEYREAYTLLQNIVQHFMASARHRTPHEAQSLSTMVVWLHAAGAGGADAVWTEAVRRTMDKNSSKYHVRPLTRHPHAFIRSVAHAVRQANALVRVGRALLLLRNRGALEEGPASDAVLDSLSSMLSEFASVRRSDADDSRREIDMGMDGTGDVDGDADADAHAHATVHDLLHALVQGSPFSSREELLAKVMQARDNVPVSVVAVSQWLRQDMDLETQQVRACLERDPATAVTPQDMDMLLRVLARGERADDLSSMAKHACAFANAHPKLVASGRFDAPAEKVRVCGGRTLLQQLHSQPAVEAARRNREAQARADEERRRRVLQDVERVTGRAQDDPRLRNACELLHRAVALVTGQVRQQPSQKQGGDGDCATATSQKGAQLCRASRDAGKLRRLLERVLENMVPASTWTAVRALAPGLTPQMAAALLLEAKHVVISAHATGGCVLVVRDAASGVIASCVS